MGKEPANMNAGALSRTRRERKYAHDGPAMLTDSVGSRYTSTCPAQIDKPLKTRYFLALRAVACYLGMYRGISGRTR